MRAIRKLVLWILGLTAAVVGAAAALFFFAPATLIAGEVDALSRAQFGRGLSFEQAVNRRLYPSLGADFTVVTLENAEWAGPEPLLKAERVAIDLDPQALLKGEFRIDALRVVAPTLNASLDENGAANWSVSTAPRPQNALEEIAAAEQMARDLTEGVAERIEDPIANAVLPLRTRIENGLIRFEDRRTGRGSKLTAFNMTAEKDAAGALTLEGDSIVNGAPTKLKGRLPDPFALLSGRADQATFGYEGEGVRFSFDGAFDLRAARLRATGSVAGSLSADRAQTAWIRRLLPAALDPLGAATLEGALDADRDKLDLTLDAQGDFNRAPLSLTLRATGGRDWRRGEAIETALTLKAGDLLSGGATGRLTVRDDAFAAFDGRIEARSANWSRVRLWAGVTPPLRPIGAIELNGALHADRATFAFTDAALTVEDAKALGELTLDWSGERLLLNGGLREGPLDLLAFAPGRPQDRLRRLSASNGEEVAAASAPTEPQDPEAPLAGDGEIAEFAPDETWSTTPLPVSVLDQAEGLFTVDLKGAALGDVTFGATDIDLKLGDGGVALEVTEIALYDGALSGAARLAKAGDAARFSADLAMRGVESEAFLAALGRSDWLRGPIDAKVTAEGQGTSMALLMGSLQGAGSAEMRDGAVLAIDFAAASLDQRLALFGARQEEAGVTPFTRARLPFVIEQGVARTEDFRIEGDVVRARGEGVVDIGDRRVDLTITPTGFGAISFLGIDAVIARAFPVRLEGPWNAVRVFLDRGRGAEARFDQEAN